MNLALAVASTFFAASLAASGTARAQDAATPAPAPAATPEAETPATDARKQEAARRFEHAIKLYGDADYALALAEFERVYELSPDYRVLYNIGQVSMQLGRYARAFRSLREYLARGGDTLPAERVQAVKADLDLLSGRVATISVGVDRPGADILVDGSVVGRSPLSEPIIVDVGERRLEVRLPGFLPSTQTLSLAGGDHRDSQLVLKPEPTLSVAPLARPQSVSPPRNGPPAATAGSERKWVGLGWAASGALLTGAVVMGVLGVSAASDLAEVRRRPTTRAELDQAQGRARSRLLAADILGGAALLGGGVTLYFQLSRPARAEERPATSRLRVELAPSSVSLVLER